MRILSVLFSVLLIGSVCYAREKRAPNKLFSKGNGELITIDSRQFSIPIFDEFGRRIFTPGASMSLPLIGDAIPLFFYSSRFFQGNVAEIDLLSIEIRAFSKDWNRRQPITGEAFAALKQSISRTIDGFNTKFAHVNNNEEKIPAMQVLFEDEQSFAFALSSLPGDDDFLVKMYNITLCVLIDGTILVFEFGMSGPPMQESHRERAREMMRAWRDEIIYANSGGRTYFIPASPPRLPTVSDSDIRADFSSSDEILRLNLDSRTLVAPLPRGMSVLKQSAEINDGIRTLLRGRTEMGKRRQRVLIELGVLYDEEGGDDVIISTEDFLRLQYYMSRRLRLLPEESTAAEDTKLRIFRNYIDRLGDWLPDQPILENDDSKITAVYHAEQQLRDSSIISIIVYESFIRLHDRMVRIRVESYGPRGNALDAFSELRAWREMIVRANAPAVVGRENEKDAPIDLFSDGKFETVTINSKIITVPVFDDLSKKDIPSALSNDFPFIGKMKTHFAYQGGIGSGRDFIAVQAAAFSSDQDNQQMFPFDIFALYKQRKASDIDTFNQSLKDSENDDFMRFPVEILFEYDRSFAFATRTWTKENDSTLESYGVMTSVHVNGRILVCEIEFIGWEMRETYRMAVRKMARAWRDAIFAANEQPPSDSVELSSSSHGVVSRSTGDAVSPFGDEIHRIRLDSQVLAVPVPHDALMRRDMVPQGREDGLFIRPFLQFRIKKEQSGEVLFFSIGVLYDDSLDADVVLDAGEFSVWRNDVSGRLRQLAGQVIIEDNDLTVTSVKADNTQIGSHTLNAIKYRSFFWLYDRVIGMEVKSYGSKERPREALSVLQEWRDKVIQMNQGTVTQP